DAALRRAIAPGFCDPVQYDAVGPAPGVAVLIGGAPHRGLVPVSGVRPGVADLLLAAADSPPRDGARSVTVEAETDPDYHAAVRDGLVRLLSQHPRGLRLRIARDSSRG